jgi:peptidoglycan/xylan/chitin deacetylase (PgdA/CDA1 family)
MKGQYCQQSQTKVFCPGSYIIAMLLVFLALVSCGIGPVSNTTPTPTARPKPVQSPTAPLKPTLIPTPTSKPPLPGQTPTTRPTPEPTLPPPAPTPVPTRPPVVTTCNPGPGIPQVSSVEVARGSTQSPRVALTFDAGGPVEPVPRILALLAKYHLHVTFFVTGQWAQQNPDLVRQIWSAGHEIGNHTMRHLNLTRLPDDQVCSELKQAESSIVSITGHTTRPYFRPPNGDRNDRVRQLAAHLGYRTIYWSIDTIDWDASTTSQMIIDRVMKNLNYGAIVLMHAGSSTEANTLDRLIPMIQQRGYQIVTVTEILR